MKKLIIFIIILIALLGLFFVYNYFTQPVVKVPTEKTSYSQTPTSTDFRGPSGPPSVKGPNGPPPGQ